MNKLISELKKEEANSMVENVIILPLLFIIIYAMIMTCFVLHDRSTIEAAAKRGAIYAAHCISDPNYSMILENSGSQRGTLDISMDVSNKDIRFDFTGVGHNNHPYRYLKKNDARVSSDTHREVESIVNSTHIPWRTLSVDDIQYRNINKLLYQDVTVTVKADYPIPRFFGVFGLDTELEYSVTAKMAVNDPDEFIRNADMTVDIICEIDNRTGNHISGAVEKITQLTSKLGEWLDKFKIK